MAMIETRGINAKEITYIGTSLEEHLHSPKKKKIFKYLISLILMPLKLSMIVLTID